jgi:hypothetical protein
MVGKEWYAKFRITYYSFRMSIALLTASSGVVVSDISWAVSSGTKVLGAI